MTSAAISLLGVIFLHFALTIAGMSIGKHIGLIAYIARVHGIPILLCVVAVIFAVLGLEILVKIFLIITLICLLLALLRTWQVILLYVRQLEDS